MSLSNVYTEKQIYPEEYTSETDYYSISTGNTSSSSKIHIYFVANETGSHTIYHKNSYANTNYRYF